MKKIASILLSLVLLMSYVTSASAEEGVGSQQEVYNLLEEYGFEVIQGNTKIPITTSVTDIEELEDVLKEFKENIEIEKQTSKEILIPASSESTMKATYNDSHQNTWWCPGNAGWGGTAVTITCNVSYDYSYTFNSNDDPYFTSLSNIKSQLDGIHLYTWVQNNASYNFTKTNYNNDTAKIKVLGYYLLGIEWNGVPIGATMSDEWNCSLRLY
ncbi:hypothetical protein D3C74_252920 [compost metagenome]